MRRAGLAAATPGADRRYRGRVRRALVVLLLLVPSAAHANGAYSHVHMSQLALESLSPGELRALLEDPENRAALEAGSMFPDSGYAISDPYGELTHWEPFLGAFIAHLRARYGDDFSSAEAQRAVAFLLGVASHGLADQSYDTTLLARAFEVDGPEEPTAPVDQYADYFLVVDQGVSFSVEPWAPYADLVPSIGDAGHVVDEGTLESGVLRMAAVLDLQVGASRTGYWEAWRYYPFLGTHVYNPAAVGSLPWVGQVIAVYWEVVWDRLHGRDDVDAQLVIGSVPADGGQNWAVDASESAAWSRPALWFGYGVDRDQIAPLLSLRDTSGADVPFTLQTAYGGRERNLVFVRPDAPLAHDEVYTLELAAGVATLDGRTTTAPFLTSFRTRCADDRSSDCPPLDDPLVTGEIPMRPTPMDLPDAGPAEPPPESGGGCAVRRGDAPLWPLLVALVAIRRRVNRNV